MADHLEKIKKITLFKGLRETTLTKLQQVSSITCYVDKQVVMLEEDRDTSVFFVLKGSVRIYRTNPDGREQTLIILQEGDTFNLPTAFSRGGLAPASVSAVGNVELLEITFSDFRCIVSETPDLALAVLEDLSDKLMHLTDLVHDISLRSVRGRLARFLIDQVENSSVIHWTQEEIAAQIGTSREMVSRTLRYFFQNRLVKRERQRLIIIDPEKLRAEAEG